MGSVWMEQPASAAYETLTYDITFLGHIHAFIRKDIVFTKFIAVYAAESLTRFSLRCWPSSDSSHKKSNK